MNSSILPKLFEWQCSPVKSSVYHEDEKIYGESAYDPIAMK